MAAKGVRNENTATLYIYRMNADIVVGAVFFGGSVSETVAKKKICLFFEIRLEPAGEEISVRYLDVILSCGYNESHDNTAAKTIERVDFAKKRSL